MEVAERIQAAPLEEKRVVTKKDINDIDADAVLVLVRLSLLGKI